LISIDAIRPARTFSAIAIVNGFSPLAQGAPDRIGPRDRRAGSGDAADDGANRSISRQVVSVPDRASSTRRQPCCAPASS
jgi:hypothetical protein